MSEKPKVDRTRAYIRKKDMSVSILIPVGDVYSRDFHGETDEDVLEKLGSMMYQIWYFRGATHAVPSLFPFASADIENYQISDMPKEDVEKVRKLVGDVRSHRGKSTFRKYEKELDGFSLELAKRYIK